MIDLIKRMFGVPAPAPRRAATPTVEPTLSFGAAGDRFVRIASLDFFGQYRRSPDGRWLLAWRDSNDAATHGGYRSSGPGRFYLFEGDRLAAQGRAERPNDGEVANNGSFVINDWLFGDGLKGVFRAYRADGSIIVERAFTANLLNNGIADDGGMAVCQTCNAPGPDGSLLVIFDLESGHEIAGWVPESGWAASYAFPAEGRIQLRYGNGQAYDYAVDGRFLDRNQWMDAQARSDNVHVLHNLLRGSALSPALSATIIASVDRTLAGSEFNPAERPLALKVRGLCQEALGNLRGALSDYEEAIALDAKIGLKRKAAELRRRLT
ncbi:tetratricopeptide repeat protein [Sphingomonas sp. CCH18-H6]|uniref:tetratricopeptide repeat protein n=1 Tax=Sphingomonas sp. CCH18-H6 TaxID=1768787 RepID=UPI00082FC8EE|nr:tetratricopeptide repeat protein [Sphingomonas sp. CCH18-H6]